MVFIDAILFIAGIIMLVKGADWLVNHATKVARTFGVSEFLIGFTLIAFATSLPELVVSLISGLSGTAEIATGTIVGSNIANIGFILGLVILIVPIGIEKTYMRDAYIMLVASVLMAFMFIGGIIFFEGIILILLLIYQANLYKIRHNKGFFTILYNFFHRKTEKTDISHNTGALLTDILIILGSTVLLIIGGWLTIASTINIATLLRVPEYFISVLAIALGTSLPEIATALIAALKGYTNISIGNIIGSNIFNISILGITSLFTIVPVTKTLFTLDIPLMLMLTAVLVLFMYTKRSLSKLEGIILLAFYAAFVYLQFVSL